jgi:protein required for attachment to host cells
MKTWVLVASAARARIFEATGRIKPWREVDDLVNPDERLRRQELKSDKPGRAYDKLGGQRHAMQTPVDPKQQVAIRFAKQVVERLEHGLQATHYDGLYIVAPPHFLGLLREQSGEPLARIVKGELIKDLTREDLATIREQIADSL